MVLASLDLEETVSSEPSNESDFEYGGVSCLVLSVCKLYERGGGLILR